LTAGAALLLAAPATAGTLDQQQTLFDAGTEPIYNDDGMGSSGQSAAQTFTAGLTGGLDQVDLYLQQFGPPTADLTVEIYDTVGGTPINSLATASISAADVPSIGYSFVPATFDPPVPVTAGTQYAIVAWTASLVAKPYYWKLNGGDPYAGGSLRVQLAANASPPTAGFWGPSGATDTVFRTYVVVPSTTGTPPPGPPASPGPTGQRAAALKKCAKKKGKKRKKCKKRARRLPV
jgi:hypothetical protein